MAGQAAIALSEMTISSTCDFVSQTQAASSAVAQTREASAEAPVKKSRSAAEVRRAFWRDLLADFRREHTLFGLVLPVPTAVSAKSGRSTHAQRVGLFWLNILIVLCFLLFQYSSVINEIAIAAGSSRSAHVGDLSDDLAARRDGYFGSGFLGIEWDNATWAIAVILIYYVVQISLRCIWWPANYRARRRRRSGHANANDPSCGHVCGWVVVGVLVFILVGLSYFFARGYSSAAYPLAPLLHRVCLLFGVGARAACGAPWPPTLPRGPRELRAETLRGMVARLGCLLPVDARRMPQARLLRG